MKRKRAISIMKKSLCIFMACLFLAYGVGDAYVESFTIRAEAVVGADDALFYVIFMVVLAGSGYAMSKTQDSRALADAFQSDLENGNISAPGITSEILQGAKEYVSEMANHTLSSWKAAGKGYVFLEKKFLQVLKAWLSERVSDGKTQIDKSYQPVLEDWMQELPENFLSDASCMSGLDKWLQTHETTDHYLVMSMSGATFPVLQFVFFSKELAFYKNGGSFFYSSGLTDLSKLGYLDSFVSCFCIKNIYNQNYNVWQANCTSNGTPWTCNMVSSQSYVSSASDGFPKAVSGMRIYSSYEAFSAGEELVDIPLYGAYYDISSMYGKSFDPEAIDEDDISSAVTNAVQSADPDISRDDLNKIVQDAVDQALDGKIVIDETKTDDPTNNDDDDDDDKKVTIADLKDLFDLLSGTLPSIRLELTNVYNSISELPDNLPNYTKYFTRILEYLNSVYNDFLDRLDQIIRILGPIPEILRTLDTSSDDKAVLSIPETIAVTFSDLIDWDSIAAHFAAAFRPVYETNKNTNINVDLPELSFLSEISGNVLEIKNFFTIDFDVVEEKTDEVADELKKKFPILQIVAFFALLDAFTVEKEFPVITMDVPEFLKVYMKSDTIVFVDFKDYKDQIEFVRSILRAVMYVFFAYYVVTRHFDFKFGID